MASLGHPSKFQPVSRLGFVTAPTSLNGGQQNFARCLAVSWAGTLYIHFGGCFPSNGILPAAIHFASRSCILLYCQRYCTALEQQPSAKLCGMVQGMELGNFCRGRHLYSAGRPSRWAFSNDELSPLTQSWRYRAACVDTYRTCKIANGN